MKKPRVLLLRGYAPNPWEFGPWEKLQDEFEITYLRPKKCIFDVSPINIKYAKVMTLRDMLPSGKLGDAAGHVLGDRYFNISKHLRGIDIVHSFELSTWFSWQAAKYKSKNKYKLALTVAETIPFLGTYRNYLRTRHYRNNMLDAAELYMPINERARMSLLLEGIPDEKIEVCELGVDLDKFAGASNVSNNVSEHTILSIGRLVWEKGHQDVIRAVAAIHNGIVPSLSKPKLIIVGKGPEARRLNNYVEELKISDYVEIRGSVPYDEVSQLHKEVSCLVLASLPTKQWEEQFGYVLAEAMAAKLWIVCSTSGAIPETVGDYGSYFPPGDWIGLAQQLATGPLAVPAGERKQHEIEMVDKYSSAKVADKLRSALERLL